MQLILTHENADFDAIAAQAAAHKLYPDAIPLLSWRLNRNVEQFLRLYWDAFSFVRPADWRRKRVSKAILVDTQSLPSVRGIRAGKVEVQVIDHHDISDRASLKSDWQYHVEPVGATTTVIVEMLRERGIDLTSNEATLLLLGIHEDTGSLIYDTTTVRDLKAAAWLLQQGAVLSTVRRFINIPLSAAQEELFKALQENAEWQTIHGRSIVLAVAKVKGELREEVSAVAHRLRDTLGMDGLIMVVQLTPDHIQLVARSTSDQVDVSRVARAMGGGGHDRAAAATILSSDLEATVEKVRAALPAAVEPARMVSQLMSKGIQTMKASTEVSVAAKLMRRSGHEGYPVVGDEDGRLLGLLTRRAVDRAMDHQLGQLSVSEVMRAGRVFVTPEDTLTDVQNLMIAEGWGQIPVLKPDGDGQDEFLGIVTRTDVIGVIGRDAEESNESDLLGLMSSSLPEAVWQLILTVSKTAAIAGMPTYFVGGLVRDLLLGKPSTDLDMVVEGDAIALVRALMKKFGGQVRSHSRFGTAKWLLNEAAWQAVAPGRDLSSAPGTIDFVTARTEFYARPTALPEVANSSIKLDLHRRDFTINTLAIRLDGSHLGERLDFYGGQKDLDKGLIRVLHSLSFIDDPTRILRAIRLEQRLGFEIEGRTVELMSSALPLLERVTGDRIRHEIEFALEESDPAAIMHRLGELGVLESIEVGLTWDDRINGQLGFAAELGKTNGWRRMVSGDDLVFSYFALWMTSVKAQVMQKSMRRLKVRRRTRSDVDALSETKAQLEKLGSDSPPSAFVGILSDLAPRVLFALRVALDSNPILGRSVELYQTEWRSVTTAVDGHDLMELGVPRGPDVGRILSMLLNARLDGQVKDDSEEEAYLTELLADEFPAA